MMANPQAYPGAYPMTHMVAGPGMVTQMVVPDTRENYATITSQRLGCFQVVACILSWIVNVLGIIWEASSSGLYFGFWCTIGCFVAGVFGIFAGRTRKATQIRAYMVFSIFGLLGAGLQCLLGLLAVFVDKVVEDLGDESDYHDHRVGVDSLLVALGVLLFGSMIWTMAITCQCCGGGGHAQHTIHTAQVMPGRIA